MVRLGGRGGYVCFVQSIIHGSLDFRNDTDSDSSSIHPSIHPDSSSAVPSVPCRLGQSSIPTHPQSQSPITNLHPHPHPLYNTCHPPLPSLSLPKTLFQSSHHPSQPIHQKPNNRYLPTNIIQSRRTPLTFKPVPIQKQTPKHVYPNTSLQNNLASTRNCTKTDHHHLEP